MTESGDFRDILWRFSKIRNIFEKYFLMSQQILYMKIYRDFINVLTPCADTQFSEDLSIFTLSPQILNLAKILHLFTPWGDTQYDRRFIDQNCHYIQSTLVVGAWQNRNGGIFLSCHVTWWRNRRWRFGWKLFWGR